MKFFRKNRFFVTFLVAIVVAVIVTIGQMRQRDKVDAAILEQGNVLTIPAATFK